MNLVDMLVAWVGSALLLIALLGLVFRGTYGQCYSFSAYLVAVLVPQVLSTVWPALYTYGFWVFKEVLHSGLKFAIVLELAYRTLRSFPGALAAGRRVALTVVGLAYFAIVTVPGGAQAEFSARVLPRVLNGTIWLFVALAAVVLWYRLPIQPLHKAILVGFVPYLLIFSVAMAALDGFGWSIAGRIAYLHTVGYLCLEAYWVHAVWRPQTARR
jgi:hypothetical protein